jgi:RNA polymerase sigma-70 factor, ECF subfamily
LKKYNLVEDKDQVHSLYLLDRKEAGMKQQEYFEYLIDTYQNLVFSLCYRFSRQYFDAEDLTQETFLSVYKNLPTFDRQQEKAWICRIATNKCLDYLKKKESKVLVMEEEFFVEQADREPPLEEQILQMQVKRELKHSCEELKNPYNIIAMDYFYHELSMQMIAEKYGKNIKTIQTQIYRAREMLKKTYGKGAAYEQQFRKQTDQTKTIC